MPRFNVDDIAFCVYYSGPIRIKSSELTVLGCRGYVADVIGLGPMFIKTEHIGGEGSCFVSQEDIVLKMGDIVSVTDSNLATFTIVGQPKKVSGVWLINCKDTITGIMYTWKMVELTPPAQARTFRYPVGQVVLLKRGNGCHSDVQLLRGVIQRQRNDGQYDICFENGRNQIEHENKLLGIDEVDAYLALQKEVVEEIPASVRATFSGPFDLRPTAEPVFTPVAFTWEPIIGR